MPKVGLRDHVVIAGYGRTGYAAARVLAGAGVPYVIIELDRPKAVTLRRTGAPVVWGDATRPEVLRAAGAERAKLLFVAMPEAPSVLMTIESARVLNSRLEVVARAVSQEQLEELNRLGVNDAVQPQFEAGLEMVGLALSRFGWPPVEIQRFNQGVRGDLYRSLQGASLPPICRTILDDMRSIDPSFQVEWVTAGPHVSGKSIADLDVRRLTGASIVAAHGPHGAQSNPPPDHVVAEGDLVLLLGDSQQRAAAREALQGGAEASPGRPGVGVPQP